MFKVSIRRLLMALFIAVGLISATSYAQQYRGVVGKNGWLFLSYDIVLPVDAPDINLTMDLLRRFNKVLAANGITMAMVLIPIKMRIYSDFLPPTIRMSREMVTMYDRTQQILKTNHIETFDLNTPFMANAQKNPALPLFLKLDSHWSPSGVLLAAETIKAGIEANPTLKKAFDATPPVEFKMEISKARKTNNSHDLVSVLPPDQKTTFPQEESLLFKVTRIKGPAPTGISPSGIALVGSSNSRPWTGFADALRFSLQRDVMVAGSNGDRGAWIGMDEYLRETGDISKQPKFMLWEMSERDLRAPPNYKFRDSVYNIDNTEWLLRVSAMVQLACKPSTISAKIGSAGLRGNSSTSGTGDLVTGATSEKDFIEINFSGEVSKLDYLSVKLTIPGTETVVLEASGPDVPNRRFVVHVSSNGMLKYPLPSAGKGYTSVRLFPGKSTGVTLRDLQVCRQPPDLLSPT